MISRSTTVRFLAAAVFPVVGAAPAADADQIVTGQGNLTHVKIVGFAEGRVSFQTADGRRLTEYVDQIKLLIVDRDGAFDDLNEAERHLAHGEAEKAAVRYRRAARGLSEFWPDLVQARLAVACDRAGKIDEAVAAFLRVVASKEGPATAARIVPRNLPDRRDGRTHRALGDIEAALHKNPSDAERALLLLVRFEIFRRTGDKDAPGEAARVAGLEIPEPVRSGPVYELVHSALSTALETEIRRPVVEALDRAIRDAPDSHVADFLLLKGRLLSRTAKTREDWVRAAWPFLRIAAHLPDDARAAEALYESARVLERIGRADQAASLLRECLDHAKLDARTREQAEHMMKRLVGDEGAGR
jgi:tetratricopeptide (TPR) repeat protein